MKENPIAYATSSTIRVIYLNKFIITLVIYDKCAIYMKNKNLLLTNRIKVHNK